MLGFFAVLRAVLSVARVVCDWKPVLESRKASFPRPSSPLTPPPVPRERQKHLSFGGFLHFPRAQPRPSRTPSSHTEHARACDSTRSHRLSSRPPVVSKALGAPASAHAHARAAIAKDRQAQRHSQLRPDRAASDRARRPPRASRAPRIDRIDRANARTRRFFRTTASTCVPPRRPATPTRTPRGTRLW